MLFDETSTHDRYGNEAGIGPESLVLGSPPPHRSVVLLVEDERISRRALTALLSASGYATQAVASAEEALKVMNRGEMPDVALIDLNLPGMNGLDLIERLEQLDPGVFPVLITATGTDALNQALNGRRVAYMRKPLDFDRLLTVISQRQPPQ